MANAHVPVIGLVVAIGIGGLHGSRQQLEEERRTAFDALPRIHNIREAGIARNLYEVAVGGVKVRGAPAQHLHILVDARVGKGRVKGIERRQHVTDEGGATKGRALRRHCVAHRCAGRAAGQHQREGAAEVGAPCANGGVGNDQLHGIDTGRCVEECVPKYVREKFGRVPARFRGVPLVNHHVGFVNRIVGARRAHNVFRAENGG